MTARAHLLARVPLVARVVLVALIAALLVSATSGASGEKAGGVVRGELDGQAVRLSLPTGPSRLTRRRAARLGWAGFATVLAAAVLIDGSQR